MLPSPLLSEARASLRHFVSPLHYLSAHILPNLTNADDSCASLASYSTVSAPKLECAIVWLRSLHRCHCIQSYSVSLFPLQNFGTIATATSKPSTTGPVKSARAISRHTMSPPPVASFRMSSASHVSEYRPTTKKDFVYYNPHTKVTMKQGKHLQYHISLDMSRERAKRSSAARAMAAETPKNVSARIQVSTQRYTDGLTRATASSRYSLAACMRLHTAKL